MLKDQPSLLINESAVDASPPAISIAPLRLDTLANASSSQSQSVYHGGYENLVGSRGTAFPDVNIEGLENGSHGMFDASASLPSFGYSQMPQRSYASFMELPYSINGHVQSYNVQELPQSGPHYHQQLFSPNIPYASSQTSLAKVPVNFELQGDGNRFVPRPDYIPKMGSVGGQSNFSGHSGGFKLLQQEFEGFESGGLWSDWPKPSNGNRPLEHFSSRAACPKQVSSLGLSVNHCGMVSQQKESLQGLGSRISPRYKNCSQGPIDRDFGYDYLSSSIFRTDGRNWSRVQEARQGARCNDFSCSCSVALETLSERNRGPRAFKPKSQATENSSAAGNLGNTVAGVCSESYNRLDFVTDYKEAKFFVIKSYSEDNVHKSIKYGVWASTPNGNKKLDAAYHEAKGKHGTCPVFLLFSVNASAQFCGVAEMVGPVDFDKSVDFWQQDKWSGQFPVKWHIIKDVPNSQFRHIVLENNDNKPVTNSRDTQEVELEQGIDMLSIFKNYENDSSILDDFHFYEERQKAMRVKKSRQQVSAVSTSVVGVREQNPVPLSNDLIKKMSKSFAEAVLLNDNEIKPSEWHLRLGMMGVEPEKHS